MRTLLGVVGMLAFVGCGSGASGGPAAGGADASSSGGMTAGGNGGAPGGSGGAAGKGTGGVGANAGTGGRGGATAGVCASSVAVTCDGPEDCPTGQLCCGQRSGAGYNRFGCYPSCTALGPVDGGDLAARWLMMCHAGSTCENPAYTCATYAVGVSPSSLAACKATGDPPSATLNAEAKKVNCGTAVCGVGEKCCLPYDGNGGVLDTPYCTPSGTPCACTHPVVGPPPADAATGG